MAADSPSAVEQVKSDPAPEAYVSPLVDFVVISFFVSILAVGAVAVILP